MRFAIGKYCDDVGDYDQAFQNYSYANKLSLLISNNQYDPDGVTVEIDKLIRTYDSKQLIHADGYGSDSTRPIFVVGMPRSGTSLLETDNSLSSGTRLAAVKEISGNRRD
ncbi:MAG: hypothetical protein WDM70_03745 [Nitrosomonadales bacterium]